MPGLSTGLRFRSGLLLGEGPRLYFFLLRRSASLTGSTAWMRFLVFSVVCAVAGPCSGSECYSGSHHWIPTESSETSKTSTICIV
jgi:hypothetical protein